MTFMSLWTHTRAHRDRYFAITEEKPWDWFRSQGKVLKAMDELNVSESIRCDLLIDCERVAAMHDDKARIFVLFKLAQGYVHNRQGKELRKKLMAALSSAEPHSQQRKSTREDVRSLGANGNPSNGWLFMTITDEVRYLCVGRERKHPDEDGEDEAATSVIPQQRRSTGTKNNIDKRETSLGGSHKATQWFHQIEDSPVEKSPACQDTVDEGGLIRDVQDSAVAEQDVFETNEDQSPDSPDTDQAVLHNLINSSASGVRSHHVRSASSPMIPSIAKCHAPYAVDFVEDDIREPLDEVCLRYPVMTLRGLMRRKFCSQMP